MISGSDIYHFAPLHDAVAARRVVQNLWLPVLMSSKVGIVAPNAMRNAWCGLIITQAKAKQCTACV